MPPPRKKRRSLTTEEKPEMSLQGLQILPPEIILLVGERLGRRDLFALIRTAGRYPHLLIPILYNSAFTFEPIPEPDGGSESESEDGPVGAYYTLPSGQKAYVNFNLTAIEYAPKWESTLIFDWFKSKDVNLFVAWDRNGVPLLHRLAEHGAFRIVEDLLKRGADVSSRAIGGYTPLHWIVHTMVATSWIARLPLIKLFLNHGADVLAVNQWEQTLLFSAVKSAPEFVVEYIIRLMLDAGGNIWQRDYLDTAPLWQAITWGNAGAVRALLHRGADIFEEDVNGCTALHKAAHKGDVAVMREIIAAAQAKGKDLGVLNHRQCNALHIALAFYKEEAATLLIEAGIDCSAIDDTLNTPLDIILHTEMKQAFNALLKATQHLWPIQTLRRSHLVDAVTYCKYTTVDMMRHLVRVGAVTPFECSGPVEGKDTLLHMFCGRWNQVPDPVRFASGLLEMGERVDVQGSHGNTPLHVLLYNRTPYDDSQQYLVLVWRLLIECKEPFDFKNDCGNTILHYAAAQSDLRLVRLVTNHIDARTFFALNKQSFTALHCLANPRCERTCRALTAAILEVSNCFPSKPVIEYLVSHGMNVNAKTNKGRTALHMASSDRRKPSVVEGLLRAGADVMMPDYEGFTPLHWANTHECDKAVEILLEHGSDLHEGCYTCDPRLVFQECEESAREKLETVRGELGHWHSEVLNEILEPWDDRCNASYQLAMERGHMWSYLRQQRGNQVRRSSSSLVASCTI